MTIEQQQKNFQHQNGPEDGGDVELVGYYDVDAVEELACLVVRQIASFIDFLRSEFGTTTPDVKTTLHAASILNKQSSTAVVVPPVNLWSRLANGTDLLNQLESILDKEQDIFNRGGSEASPTHDTSSIYQNLQELDDNDDDERRRVVVDFALPLIRAFTSCYTVLDRIPITTQEKQPMRYQAADIVSRKVAEAQNITRQRKKNYQPPPPRGMLSLQNYTDIASMFEFVVCTGILPHLEDGILWNITDRVNHQLPKSLVGRIPRMSLHWGVDVRRMSEDYKDSLVGSRTATKKVADYDELIKTICAMTDALLLDRFRPMMLPRHLSDLHAALFQAEQLGIQISEHETVKTIAESSVGRWHVPTNTITTIYRSFGLTIPSTMTNTADIDKPSSTHPIFKTVIDPTLQARTYQSLLLNGRQSPLWLRRRVAPLLTELACQNLAVIIAVFVPQQGNRPSELHDSMSSSSCQRLGQTLATSAGRNDTTISPQHRRLCTQVRQLLYWAYPQTNNDSLSSQVLTVIQTAWAILCHSPPVVIESCMLAPWRDTLTQPQQRSSMKDNAIHRVVQEIGALFSFIPPPQYAQRRKMLDFMLWSKSDTAGGTIFGQLARLSSASKLEATKSPVREDVRHVLCVLTQSADETYDSKRDGSVDDALVVAWIDSLSPSPWELNGYCFKWNDQKTEIQHQPSEIVVVLKEDRKASSGEIALNSYISEVLEDTTARVSGFLEHVLKVLVAPDGTDAGSERTKLKTAASFNVEDSSISNLPSRIFRWLLQTYLQGSTSTEGCSGAEEEDRRIGRRFSSLILLPKICEEFPHGQLLFGEGDDGRGLLLIIKNTISQLVLLRKGKLSDDADNNSRNLKDEIFFTNDSGHWNMIKCFVESQQQEETLPAIASIVMSMLIAMLELGSKKRSDEEESLLQSVLPLLLELSQFADQVGVNAQEDTAIVDMATYAMSLLAARRSTEKESNVRDGLSDHVAESSCKSNQEKLRELLGHAALDLKSTQPPIRAKGMVTLGRLARGFAGSLRPQQTSFVKELDYSSGPIAEGDDLPSIVNEIMHLSMEALSDEESYVYLAAVQTIVALGDLHAKYVLPVVAAYVATGHLTGSRSSSTLETASNEQRIKLAEALMFMIRRRAVLDEYIPTIVRLMIYGTASIGVRRAELVDEEDQVKVLQATQTYFVGEVENDLVHAEKDEKIRYFSEREIRLQTGGPIFDIEEADVVRSVRVSVLAELVLHSLPHSIAPHLHDLVRLIIDALRFDHSRSVSRAAALLAVAVYSNVVEESDAILCSLSHNGRPSASAVAIPFSLALVKSDEAMLVTSLETYESTRVRLNDEATAARCREALKLRLQAAETGILLTAQLMANEEEKAGYIPSLLASMLGSNDSAPSSSKIVELDPVKVLEER